MNKSKNTSLIFPQNFVEFDGTAIRILNPSNEKFVFELEVGFYDFSNSDDPSEGEE